MRGNRRGCVGVPAGLEAAFVLMILVETGQAVSGSGGPEGVPVRVCTP